MKSLLGLLLMFTVKLSFPQESYSRFAGNGDRIRWEEITSPDTLAQWLTQSCKTDYEKAETIFRWIAENIEYRTKSNSKKWMYEPEEPVLDTAADLRLFNDRAARRVLKRRVAVCEGYARLFKSLCDYAGLQSEIISGYGRTSRISSRFTTNHSWNAVYIDSTWRLLDVTWASGYIAYLGDAFVRQYNDRYFLTPPERFIQDHYPEDPQWALLPDLPVLREFYNTPFKTGAFVKGRISAFLPAKGIIEATLGDSILFELRTTDAAKELRMFASPVADGADTAAKVNPPSQSFVSLPGAVGETRFVYTYKVESDSVEWLDVVCNGELMMRYKLQIKRPKKP